jgi:carboxylesterase
MRIIKRSPDPFTFKGTHSTGVLLIHGFTGSPSELRRLGGYLNDQGYTVHAPLLAGHGKTAEVMNQTGHSDWYSSALEGYDHLCELGVDHVVVAGLSMGGLLALKLAAEEDVDAVIPMCAPIFIKDRRAILSHVIKYLIPYIPRGSVKKAHIEEEIVPLDRTPVGCVASLRKLLKGVRDQLPLVKSPAYIVQAGMDETVDPNSSNYIYQHIGSDIKEMKLYPASSHIITLDHDREKLFSDIVKFIQSQEQRFKIMI